MKLIFNKKFHKNSLLFDIHITILVFKFVLPKYSLSNAIVHFSTKDVNKVNAFETACKKLQLFSSRFLIDNNFGTLE